VWARRTVFHHTSEKQGSKHPDFRVRSNRRVTAPALDKADGMMKARIGPKGRNAGYKTEKCERGRLFSIAQVENCSQQTNVEVKLYLLASSLSWHKTGGNIWTAACSSLVCSKRTFHQEQQDAATKTTEESQRFLPLVRDLPLLPARQLLRLLGTIDQLVDRDADQLPVGDVSQRQVDFSFFASPSHPF
jgi:hypothetical protein